ncbi:MAG: carboxypeptidase regulatory-like domain-containing protein [Acidobacteria bacterium]|nr:carboxypeptidase regulatory-like domain-containing protein [Acidobacteriota bacterium]MBI3426935.1 carboxypeptidase regulatory-like domain-containing protein [Acidobacteriota bacterium]
MRAAAINSLEPEARRGVTLVATIDTITGTLEGKVLSSENGPGVPDVVVRAINEETGNPRSRRTNEAGFYSIPLLPVGKYRIEAEKSGFVVKAGTPPVKVNLNQVRVIVPDIILEPVGATPPVVAVQPPTPTPAPTPAATTNPAALGSTGQLTNQTDAARRSNADESQLLALPLADSRTFDVLATLAAGVASPPQVAGVAGPGIGAGIGTAGQFAVNGQRARSNNFTVDGSDNNDEDVGVRRQGFTALVPQSIESVKEIQIVTSLWDAEAGRSSGSQVNAVSRSGTNKVHGTLYDFFNHNALNARNFFDYSSDKAPSFALTARAIRDYTNGQPDCGNPCRRIPVTIRNSTNPNEGPIPIVRPNPSLGEDQFQRNLGGGAIGFPLHKDKTFFFGSYERQDVKARQEHHFSVPNVNQRGFLGFGASGFVVNNRDVYFPTSPVGDSVFSLFPLPNNPLGPYGENTFTQVLPADGVGTIFSAKVDHSFSAWGKEYTATARYNFTNDERIVPAVGGAIYASLIPRVGTQNVSLFLNSELSTTLSNQLRASYGRTRLRFTEKRDAALRPSFYAPKEGFLLNTGYTFNNVNPLVAPNFVDYVRDAGTVTDQALGTVGQLIVAPFSPLGTDVNLFPQARANNTIQVADALTQASGRQTLKYGFDLRRTQLNSFLNRNYRPQVVFGGAPDLTAFFPQAPARNISQDGPTPGFFSGTDFAALGLPSNITQALALNTPDSTIGLRFWQLNFFLNDNWRARRGLTLDFGVRYELNTVPNEINQRIEQTFALNQLPANDPNLRIVNIYANPQRVYDPTVLTGALNNTLAAYRRVLGNRQDIYEADFNNVAPRFGLAWDPLAHSKTQAGKTVVRAGFGVYYDLNLGSVVSQSRNVFPTFIPVNIDANTFGYAQARFWTPLGGTYGLFNPRFVNIGIQNANATVETSIIGAGQLNAIRVPNGVVQQLLGLLFDPAAANPDIRPSGGGLAFTLPDKNLRSPYTLQYNLQFERELSNNLLVNLAYVGTKGVKLTRFRTPNGGPNSINIPFDILGLLPNPRLTLALPPLGDLNSPRPTRPNAQLGAYTIFDSTAASNYHSLQASLTKRYAQGFQFTAAYTWSHAIDDVSDVFDVAGAFALPQDDRNLLAERASANFDVRHRFVWSAVGNVPLLHYFNDSKGVTGVLFGNWQFASLSAYQTGQPFTVNSSYDINLDGNLTDRLDRLTGLQMLDDRQQRLALTANPVTLLAGLGQNGRIGRNTFRAAGVFKTDLAVFKNFRLREGQSLVFRVEAFNLWNRTHFAIPVRVLEAPSFGRSTETLFNARQIQFALKYVF